MRVCYYLTYTHRALHARYTCHYTTYTLHTHTIHSQHYTHTLPWQWRRWRVTASADVALLFRALHSAVLAAAAQHSSRSRQPLGLSAQAHCNSSSSSSESSQRSAAGGVAAQVAHFSCYCCCLSGTPVAASTAGHCWGRLVQCSAVYTCMRVCRRVTCSQHCNACYSHTVYCLYCQARCKLCS
jgi:hypothetical protein